MLRKRFCIDAFEDELNKTFLICCNFESVRISKKILEILGNALYVGFYINLKDWNVCPQKI